MKIPRSRKVSSTKSTISKEFSIGFLAILIGGYNMLTFFEVINVFVEIPQIIGSILLVLAGLFLWITAYKVTRYKYHTSRIF